MRRTFPARRAPEAQSISELRHLARRRLPGFVFEYVEGGAEDEVTLRRNREAFEGLALVPRALRDVAQVDGRTRLFEEELSLPLVVAPTGGNGLLHSNGDLAIAKAARSLGIPFSQSTASNARIEDIAGLDGLRHWFQLYVFRDRSIVDGIIDRAAAAGVEALILTVDANVFGNREWDRRNYAKPSVPRLSRKLETLRHPRWMRDVLMPGLPSLEVIQDFLPEDKRSLNAATSWSRDQMDPSLSWRDLDRIRGRWKGRLIVKGLLSPEDAVRARDAGADGIVLSNHGGRQLDGAVSPMQTIGKTRDMVGPDMVVLLDGGVRRGSDIAKAVAMGADAVLAGRAILYGLAAGGEAGAAHAIAILKEELLRVLALLGCRSVAELNSGFSPIAARAVT